MKEEVGYLPEEPIRAPVEVDDWRVQEMYNMAPDAVMEELLGLSDEILDAKTEWEETKSELRQAQERLKLMKVQVLQAATESSDPKIAAQVAGKNVEVRKRKADVYLADHLTVKQLVFEIKPLLSAESTTRLAMEALLDRQKNLHQWARMFEAQVKLLSTVRMPEPGIIDLRSQPEIGHVWAKAYREPWRPGKDLHVIFEFAKKPESEIVSFMKVAWEDARKWREWYANPVGPPPVDTVELIERIVKVQKSLEKEDVLAAMTAGGISVETSDVDELFPPDIEIPPSLNVPEEEADDVKAAIGRYADESPGSSL